MHLQPRLCPRPHWGSLQCSPRLPSWLGKGEGEEQKGRDMQWEGREDGEGRSLQWLMPPTPLFVVSVPVIVENQCRTYTYSIQLHSPSPLTSPIHVTGVEHYLLYREASVNKIWKSISLYGRVDHRVFGLEPDTLYDFVVMACDSNCECQVSNMVTMKTERSAY